MYEERSARRTIGNKRPKRWERTHCSNFVVDVMVCVGSSDDVFLSMASSPLDPLLRGWQMAARRLQTPENERENLHIYEIRDAKEDNATVRTV